jgi:hypothetical protein
VKGDPTLLSGHRRRIDNATGRSESDHRAGRRLPAIEDAVGIDLEVTHEVGLLIYGDVRSVAMMQELVPRDVLGRVSSLVNMLAFSLGRSRCFSAGSPPRRSESARHWC